MYLTVPILLALCLMAGCYGCCPARKTTSHKTAQRNIVAEKDSVVIVKKADAVYHERIVHDSTVGIAEKRISLILPETEAADTMARDNQLRLHVYKDNKGRQHIDCSADSLTMVIARLVKDSTYQSHVNDSSYADLQQAFYSSVESSTTAVVPGCPLWHRIAGWIVAAMAGIVAWEAFKRAYQSFRLPN